MDDDEFTSAFNAPRAEDGFSNAFRTATSKQMPQAMPSPWEAYGVPKYPAQESTLMRMGRGANVALTKAGTGLKGLFADLSEEDIAKLRAGEAYMQEAGLPATVGGLGVDIAAEAAAMTPMGKLPFLTRLIGAGGTAAALSPEDRAKSGMYGAAGQGIGEGIAKGLGAMFRGPVAAHGVKEFVEAGGEPTIGQALGGGIKPLEEKATSLPFIGTHIAEAQKRALESFNTSTLQGIVDTLNKGIRTGQEVALPGQAAIQRELVDLGKIEPTAEGFSKVKKAVSNAYDNLVSQSSGAMTPELASGLQGIKDLSKNLRPEFRNQIDDILENSVISRFKDGQRVDGRSLKEMLSELRTVGESYNKSSIADERRVGDAAKEAANQLKQMMEMQNPRYAEALSAADNAYRDVKRMETAMTSSVGHEMATPASLLQALRGRNRAGYAEGQMPMQVSARQAQDIIGNKYPDSGSAGRLGLNELIGAGITGIPAGLATFFGGKAFYSPELQKLMVKQSLKEAGPIRSAVGQGLSRMGPYVGSVGAGAAQQGRR
jgi:hypothetical protein